MYMCLVFFAAVTTKFPPVGQLEDSSILKHNLDLVKCPFGKFPSKYIFSSRVFGYVSSV